LAGDQPNGLAVSRVSRRLPRVTDARKAKLDVTRRRVKQSLDRVPTSTGDRKIARHVVHEEILEDVGTLVSPPALSILLHPLDEFRVVPRPLILGKKMLVRVYKGQ
jgi:hypothetical protein